MTNWSGAPFFFPYAEKQLAVYQADKKQLAFSAYSNEMGECIGHIVLGMMDRRQPSARIGKGSRGGEDEGSSPFHLPLPWTSKTRKPSPAM